MTRSVVVFPAPLGPSSTKNSTTCAAMKKFTNLPGDLVYKSMQGFAAAHAQLVNVNLDPLFVTRKRPNRSKVALISGGGSGHEPLHTGFVGLGIELYLLYQLASEHLRGAGLEPVRSLVGNYTTSLEMAGASLTVTLLDEAMKSLWDAPVVTPALRW
jgi:dihydroxyacetone kinase